MLVELLLLFLRAVFIDCNFHYYYQSFIEPMSEEESITNILASMGVTNVEPMVVNALLEYSKRK